MDQILVGVRRGDLLLGLALTALGVLLMVENIVSTDSATRVDNQSWALVPVFAAATLPIIWRRRNMPMILGLTAVALAVHVLAFGWDVRCGAGLPLSFALGYSAGRLMDRRDGVLGLVAVLGIQTLVLAKDSAAGLGIIPVTAVIAAAFWAAGVWLRSRSSETVVAAEPVPARSYV